MAQANPPLSPHVGIYRWQVSNTLSILHRATGLMLTMGAVVFTVWLVGMAAGPDAYFAMVALFRSPIGVSLLVGWSFCFFYHLSNGIRHLVWDAGYGFEIPVARRSGFLALGVAAILTGLFWFFALSAGGVTP